ncbi:MAG TPA: MFS transporter [Polyangia bacterium]|jgi:predicted MFS family arabinose efflux permease|nr:MFS transporter [Polyangia bacterium]
MSTEASAAPVAAPGPGPAPAAAAPAAFSSYQKFVVGVLAFLQFTIILDFMIISPLGAILLRDLHIETKRFGLVVSAYAFSAAVSGLLAAGFADRFDRKKLLLFFYAGFTLGTLLCGVAPTYEFLLGARIVTGIFGGVIGSISMAIITDLFPLSMRGRVMGVVQTSFAASQVLGLPIGLYLANTWGWHAPFLMIVGLTVIAGLLIFAKLKPIDEHLKLQSKRSNPFSHLFHTVANRRYVQTFMTTILLATGGFMLMPFGSAYTVNNIKIGLDQLPTIYAITGIGTLISGPYLGRLSDRIGKYPLFVGGSVLTAAMVLIYTHLGPTPLAWLIALNVLLFMGITSRMISATALISAVPDPAHRGSFMSVNSSLQQAAGGVGAFVAGLIVVQTPSGALERYDVLGYVVMAAMLIVVVMLRPIDRMVKAMRA